MNASRMDLHSFSRTPFCRMMAKILVALMVFQTFPLWELSRSHQWSPEVFAGTVHGMMQFFGTGEAQAAPPVADAGGDRSLVKNRPSGSSVLLDGLASFDPNGDPLTYEWYGPFVTTSGATPAVIIPEGTYSVSLAVDDGTSRSPVDTATLSITPCFGLTARAKSGKVQLVWTHQPGTERYDIFRAQEAAPQTLQKIGETTSTYSTYLDATVVNETTYVYVVAAVNSGAACYSGFAGAHPTASRTASNYAPVITSSPVTVGTVGIPYNYQILATDPNGDALNFALISAPSGMTIDPADGLISWVPLEKGPFAVVAKVDDGRGQEITQTFTVTVVEATTPNRTPLAQAGPDQTVPVGSTPMLDGSKSTDADGDPLTYLWTLLAIPAGSTAALSDPAAVKPTFLVDKPGTYVARLVVNDGKADSAPDEVIVSTENSKPVAEAGSDQTALVGQTVNLDGSKSSDVDGDPLTLAWTLTAVPSGSTAQLSDPATVKPTLAIDKPGTYVVQLVVNDGTADSDPDSVTIITENSKPVANAGPDQTAHVGETVTLDGSKSSDVDGNPLTFKWALIGQPAGSIAQLSSPAAVKPDLTIDKPGTYVAQLIVNDSTVDSDPDTVTFITENSKPVAEAGPDQTAHVGETVTLDGSKSTDVDSDLLTHKWSLTIVPAGSGTALSDPGAVKPQFSIDKPGTYVAQLIVNDGTVDSDPDTVTVITENSMPVANAGPAQTVQVGDTVTLDGSASSDVDGDPLIFKWSLTAVPTGSAAALSDPAAQQPTFSVDKPGTYVAQLIVNDGQVDSAPATVTISTINSKPAADAGPDQTVYLHETVTLDGTGSSDADFDPLTYLWSFTTRPAGSSATLSSTIDPQPSFDADREGTYVAQLIVSDGKESSAPDTVTITANVCMVNVPGVVGMTQADAEAAIVAAKLVVGTVTTATSSTVPAGNVISQNPAAAASVPEGSPVALVVSLGPVMVNVPNVVSMTQANAEAALVAAGLAVGTITTANSSTVAAGSVVSQNPTAAASVPEGSRVDLVVSLGQGTPILVSIAVTPTDISLESGSTRQYLAGGTFSDGSTEDLTTSVTWETADPAVAGITPTGLLRGQDPGTTTVSASQGGVTGSTTLTVTAPALVAIVVTPATPSILVNQTQAFVATGVYTDGTSENLTSLVTWDSSNPTVASITSAGVATGLADGTTSISAARNGIAGSIQLTVRARVTDSTPPTAAITAPANNSTLTSAVDIIGTANDANLLKYVLEYALAGETNFTTVATGTTEVVNGTLGRFDPTTLLNDLYTVRLTVFDRNGNMSSASAAYEVTRDQKVGNFTLAFQDLTIPLSGLPITINRVYDSRDKAKGDFGIGWRLDIQTMKVRTNRVQGTGWRVDKSGGILPTYYLVGNDQHKVSISLPDGKVEEFDLTPTPVSSYLYPLQYPTAQYTPRAGTLGTLQALANNNLWVIGEQPGTVTLVDDGYFEPYDPQTFQYTSVDGRVFVIDKEAGVQSIREPNGNTLTIGPSGITHSSGKAVSFTRDGQGRITRITDPKGNVSQYAYNANGDLTGYSDPLGNTTRYFYNLSHGLIEIRDPRGIRPIRNEYDEAGRLLRHIDAFGKTIEYTHDLNARQELITNRLGYSTLHEYDTAGNVVRTTDALGGVTSRTYDSRGNILTETDPLGRVHTYTYDARDNRLTDTNALGHTTTYTYNSRRQMLTITNPLGQVITNVYDANGNLLSMTDPLGKVSSYTYGSGGLITSKTDPLGKKTFYEHDAAGNLTKETDSLGHVTTFTYDANGNRTSETRTRTTGSGLETVVTHYDYDQQNRLIETLFPDGSTTQVTYDSLGKRMESVDQLGRRTSYSYDDMGRLVQTVFPDGLSESATYDAEGHRLSSTDRANRVTAYAYDELGRLTETTLPDSSKVGKTYDLTGQVITSTDALGHTTRYEYDEAGRRTKVIDAMGQETSFVYDNAGNQLTVNDANGHAITFEYDNNNRRTKVTYQDGTFDTTTYDDTGRVIVKTDQAGKSTHFEYDANGRLTSVMDALGAVTSYSYDECGNLISRIDANNHATQFVHDSFGRLIQRTLPLGQVETFSYDVVGNLASKEDFNGHLTTFTYDELNRLIGKRPDAALGQSEVRFTYTETGQRSTMEDSIGITIYSYDSSDRLVTKATPQGSLTYSYDAAGNLTSINSSNTHGVSINYEYDSLNRLTRVVDNRLANGETTYSYDAAGNLAGYVYPNGVETHYSYNSLNRLQEMSVNRGAASLASYTYGLGPAGERRSVVELNGRQISYVYDDIYRLTRETITGDAIPANNGAVDYAYDPVGNRLSRTSSLGAVASQNFAFDANDRLTSQGYDANGNTVSSDGRSYEYDFEDHLIEQDGPEVHIGYDGDGNRVIRTVGSVATFYMVDDRNPTGHAQVLEEIENGSVIRVYTYGTDLISQNQLISGSWQVSFYGYDGHGTVRLLTDEDGMVTDEYDFDAFGNPIRLSGSTPNQYLYSGERLDPALGLYYLRARYFSSPSGRFMTSDPWTGNIFDPPSLHKYTYAQNDPVNHIDPTGKFTMSIAVAIGIGALMGAVTSIAADYALGKAITLSSVLVGAAVGAGVGAAVFLYPVAGVAIGAVGVLSSTGLAVEVFLNRSSTPLQKTVAGVLLLASLWGGYKALQYASSVNYGRVSLNDRRLIHDESVDSFISFWEQNGGTVVGKEIYVKSPLQPIGRRYDVVLRSPATGELTGIEIKSTKGAFEQFNKAQFASDRWVNMFGGKAFGEQARAHGIEGQEVNCSYKILWSE